MAKPSKLEKGDTIAFLAPAGGLASLTPHRLEKGIEFFEKQGYKVNVFPTAKSRKGLSSDTPENRAKDINEAFKDKTIKAIISTIGGNSAHQTLEYIDFNLIKKNPKIFCGYSDITSLHLSFYSQSGLIGFYGPAVITQFGEHPNPDQYTVEHFFKAAKGKILGGCLPVILHLSGTKYWPSFKDKILLLETPEGDDYKKGETLANIDSAMGDLRNLNVFKEIKGLIFGRGFSYNEDQINQIKEIILMNTRGSTFPILYGIDIGHSDPMITIPLGVEVEIDSEKNLFSITESGVS